MRQPFFAVRAFVRGVMKHAKCVLHGLFDDWIKHFRIRKFVNYCERAGLC